MRLGVLSPIIVIGSMLAQIVKGQGLVPGCGLARLSSSSNVVAMVKCGTDRNTFLSNYAE